MKSFHQTFKDRIDMTNGTVVLDEPTYKEIQRNILERMLEVVSNEGQYGLTIHDIVSAIREEINSL
jgi:altronate dehydratase